MKYKYTFELPGDMERQAVDALLELLERASPEGSDLPARARLGAGKGKRWKLTITNELALLEVPGEPLVKLCADPLELGVRRDGEVFWDEDLIHDEMVVLNPLALGATSLGWDVHDVTFAVSLADSLRATLEKP
jgi:hypothetical protein